MKETNLFIGANIYFKSVLIQKLNLLKKKKTKKCEVTGDEDGGR